MDFALIPFRGLDGAKQRLRDVLSPQDRSALAWAMLHDVIDAIAASALSPRIVVVTRNPSDVCAAVPADVAVIADWGEGLNAAIETGFGHVARHAGPDARVLTIAADLPLLRSVTIDRAFAALCAADTLVLAPAGADGGTNLFGQSAACRVAPAFGLQSFRTHVAAAATAGLDVHVVDDVEAGRDIDRRDDLSTLAASLRVTRSVQIARAADSADMRAFSA